MHKLNVNTFITDLPMAAKNQVFELQNKFNTNKWFFRLLNRQIQKKRHFSDPKYVSVNHLIFEEKFCLLLAKHYGQESCYVYLSVHLCLIVYQLQLNKHRIKRIYIYITVLRPQCGYTQPKFQRSFCCVYTDVVPLLYQKENVCMCLYASKESLFNIRRLETRPTETAQNTILYFLKESDSEQILHSVKWN